jgi:Spy/CpxP family protein refolding chaperone
MKKMITVAFAFLLIAGSASAQDKQDRRGEEKANHLGLSEAQKAEMKKIHDAEKAEMDALKNDEKLSAVQKKEAREAIHEKYQEQFKNVLTEEQRAKAEAHRPGGDHRKAKDMRHEADSSRQKPAHGPKNAIAKHRDAGKDRGDEMKEMQEELGLSDAQKSEIAKLRAEFKTQADAIKNNEQLSKEEKQKQFKALGEKQKQQMKAVLTPEQREKLESKMKNNRTK